MHRHYGVLNFLGDIGMICITGGLWFIWVFVREMRLRPQPVQSVHSIQRPKDEGEVEIMAYVDQGGVVLKFSSLIDWIGLSTDKASDLAVILQTSVAELRENGY